MKINVRLLIILLVLGIGTIGTFLLVHYFQMRQHAIGFLDLARTNIESNDGMERRRGIEQYAHYLKYNSSDAKVRTEFGIALRKQRQRSRALNNFQKAILDDPTNQEALYALAEMMLSSGRVSVAQENSEKLLKLDSKNSEYREMLAKCLILNKEYKEAEKHLLTILKEEPSKVTSYLILAQLYHKELKQPKDSQKIIDQMIEKNPKVAEAYRLRSIYYSGLKKKEEVLKNIEKALELAPKDFQTLWNACMFARSYGNLDEEKKYSMRMTEVAPKSPEGYLRMAYIESKNRNPKKSLAWIQKGIDATGGTFYLLFQKVEKLLDEGKIPEAEQTIVQLSKITPTSSSVVLSYLEARLNFAKENWARAKNQFKEIRPDLEKLSTKMLGRLSSLKFKCDFFAGECYRQLGDHKRGEELTNRSLRENARLMQEMAKTNDGSLGGGLFLRRDPLEEGRILRQEGKPLEAIRFFKRMTQNESTKVNAYVALFPLLVQRTLRQDEADRDWSEVDSALAEIKKLLPDDPRFARIQVQAILAKDRKNTQEAEAVLDEAVKHAKTRAKQWDKLLSEVKSTLNTKTAVDLLKNASETWVKQNPNIQKSIKFIEAGQRAQALEYLERGKKAQADTQRLWLARVGIARLQKDWDRAEEITRRAIHTVGDSSTFRKTLAVIIVERGGEDAPTKLETVLKDIDKIPEAQQQGLWMFVAAQFKRLGKNNRAIELCETAAKKKPNNLFIRQMLFELALSEDNKKILAKTLDEIRKIDEQGPNWNYLNARKLIYPILDKSKISDEDRETIETAINHLHKAEIQRPNWGKASLLLGKLYIKIGNIKAASTNLAKAIELGEQDPSGLSILAKIYISEGRTREAQKLLDMQRRSGRGLSSDALLAMAQMKLMQKDKRGAMAELLAAIEVLEKQAEESKSAATYLKLAQVLGNATMLAPHIDRADLAESFRQKSKEAVIKASKADPTDYRPWIILAKYYKDKDENDLVEEMVSQIKNNVPEEKKQIALTQCYNALNRTIEAELACEKALLIANKENDIARQVALFYFQNKRDTKNHHPKAEATVRKILSGKLPASKDDIMWARRRLALLLFSKGLQKDRVEAMKLINKNLKANPDSLMDLRVQARGLAIKGTRKDKQRSIKLLEKIVKRPHPAPEDLFQLAKLYWAHGDWNGSSAQMRILLSTPNPKTDWYEFYTRCLINRNEYSSAQMNWEKFKTMRPDTFPVTELEAFIYSGTNQADKAINALEAFLNNSKSKPDNEIIKLTLTAKTAEGLAVRLTQKEKYNKETHQKYIDFAEKNYRAIAKKHDRYAMALANFLGRNGKRDEAIDLAEKTWKINKPQLIAASTVRLLNAGNATPKQIERVENILNSASKHFGDRSSLDLAMAELRALQKRHDDAEKIYRKVLKADPKNIIALNNLAVFLALRKVKLDEALRSINKAIELAGPQATLLDSRSSVYLAQKNIPKALDDIDSALQEHHSAVRFFHQAQIQMAAGNKEGAKKSIKEALNLGLQPDQLQPLERPTYRALRNSLR